MTPRIAIAAATLCLVAGSFVALLGRAPSEEPGDTLLFNGHIYTSNPAQPWAEAVAIRAGKILAVGSTASLQSLRGANTKAIDLAGRMAMPGIIDTHAHFLQGSALLAGVSIAGLDSTAAVKAKLADYANAHPGDDWIYGGGWDYGSFWPGGLPTKELLDEIFPHRPVLLLSTDTHSAWVNSSALARAKITHDTPNPNTPELHGIIVRDPKTGDATGVLEEGAQLLVGAAMDDEFLKRDIRAGEAAANQHGITSVINASGSLHEMLLYSQLRDCGELTLRTTTAMSDGVGTRHSISAAELAQLEEVRTRFKDDWVRAGPVKFFADGVVETHTAAMLEPYANAKTLDEKGTTLYTPEEFTKDFLALDKLGFQVMTHSVGDAAVRTVINAYEAVEKQNGPRDRRWRIEHLEVVAPSDVARLAPLRIIASIQPWCCASLDEPWGAGLGTVRMAAEGIPWQDIASSGATLILGSDWPVEPINPFVILQTGLTRQTPDGQPAGGFYPKQALTLDQMLPAYTRNAAYAEFMEDRLGQLRPGYLADVIVLSQDLYKIPPNSVGKTQVLLTMVDGKIVWRSGF
jgi:predicted amidohydrolase YtcJ